jgi:POT family proton-dependent oligopeptide transporter
MILVCDRYVLPFLANYGIRGHISKITLGFILGAVAMAWAAYLQHSIYTAGPCYTTPMKCDAALRPDGTYAPNEVSVLWQMPVYVIIALSEIFASVPGMEFAYTRAPAELKSFVMGLFILTNASSAVIGMAVSPFAVDPKVNDFYISAKVVTQDANERSASSHISI